MYIMWESGEKIGYRRKSVKLNKKTQFIHSLYQSTLS